MNSKKASTMNHATPRHQQLITITTALLAMSTLTGCATTSTGSPTTNTSSSSSSSDISQYQKLSTRTGKNINDVQASAAAEAKNQQKTSGGKVTQAGYLCVNAKTDPGCHAQSYMPSYGYVQENRDWMGVLSDKTIMAMKPGEVKYSKLDSLGRAGTVRATVTLDMVNKGSASTREELPNPSGWPAHNSEVSIYIPNYCSLCTGDADTSGSVNSGKFYHGYMYNRSYLLNTSLGGEATTRNLITGTHMQSVGANSTNEPDGMAYTETLTRNWLKAHPDGYVRYLVVPVYYNSDKIPFDVMISIQGVTSTATNDVLSENVDVANAAYGYTINYNNGDYAKDPTIMREDGTTPIE
jgi:DNA-entry nuclease